MFPKSKFKLIFKIISPFSLIYFSSCIYLYLQQDNLIFRPVQTIQSIPDEPKFNLTYKNVWINVPDASDKIHGWWFSASENRGTMKIIPNEPRNLITNQTILYLCGRGGNKSYDTNLFKIQGFLQLGFNVLAIDYRGYGQSQGDKPRELTLYQDSEATWQYLTQEQKIAPETITIYGESLGGAVAINLAYKKPQARALIVQSSFTSMKQQVFDLNIKGLQLFPLEMILNQKFDSISKIKSLQMPVLFLHGTKDKIIHYNHSQKLYDAASEPKQLFLIPKGNHFNIYRPNDDSYLKAIAKFIRVEQATPIIK